MNSRFFIHITLLFAAVAFLACSSEDDVSALGGQPLVLYADMPMTRSTVDNQWSVGDEVAVRIGEEIKIYYIKDAETGELEASSGTEPFRWSSSFNSVEVTAWSLGGFTNAEPLTGITIPEDQSGGYDSYDLLYAKGTLTPSNTHLTFYHQMAKVVVQLQFKDLSGFDPNDIDVYLGFAFDIDNNWEHIDVVPLTADFTAPNNGNFGTWSDYRDYPEYAVTMRHDSQSVEDGYHSAYSALLIPKDYSGTRFISVNMVADEGLGYVPAAGEANLEPGHTYIYRITVCNDFLNVTVETDQGDQGTNSVTPWAAP